MKNVTIPLTDVDFARLEALARAKNATPEACLVAMVRACQPNGSGWTHPTDSAKKSKP